MSVAESEKGFLRRQWEFAGTFVMHPIKTVKNIAAGLTEGPVTAGKVVFGASTIFGAATLAVGVINADPLLSVIGATFLSVGGSHLNAKGAEARTERHAETVEGETAESVKPEAKIETVKPPEVEKTASEKLASVLGTGEDETKSGFKPDLARFKKPVTPESGFGSGPQ